MIHRSHAAIYRSLQERCSYAMLHHITSGITSGETPMVNWVVRAITPQEIPIAGDLAATVLARGDSQREQTIRRFWRSELPGRPNFTEEMCRIGLLENQIVSVVLIEEATLVYGTVQLKVAGISQLCTHPKYRNHGYTSAVIQDALTFIAEQGVHLALLNHSTTLAQEYGFSPIFPQYYLEIRSEDAAALQQHFTIRAAVADDLPYIATLYHRHWGGRLAFKRSPEVWRWRFASSQNPILVVDDGQHVQGYLWGGRAYNTPVEVVADNRLAAMSLLALAGQWHQAAGNPMLRWFVPPDDAIVTFVRDLVPITLSAFYQPTGGWMARLIDTPALIQTLLPELIAQAQFTHSEVNTNTLLVNCQPDSVHLRLNGHERSACQLDHREFIQIMFGSLRPSALALRSRMRTEAVQLLELLFPPRIAQFAAWDWF